jgi:hypothetical protein
LAAVIAVIVLAIVGVGLLVVAALSLNTPTATPAPATNTQVVFVPTAAVVIPTVTPAPTQAPATPTTPPTEPPPTTAPTTDTSPRFTASFGANIRSGPGTNYPIVNGIAGGETVPVTGRSADSQWLVVSFAGSDGWVAAFVGTFSGDLNALPVVAAEPPPATLPPPTATRPANTAPPPATNTPSVYSSNGIVGQAFWVENATAGVNQMVWFNFKVTNTSNAPVSYSVLAAHSEVGPSAKSWSNEVLQAGQTLEWRDHIEFTATGTYRLYLGICYGGFNPCMANQATWDRLSPSITVTIQ